MRTEVLIQVKKLVLLFVTASGNIVMSSILYVIGVSLPDLQCHYQADLGVLSGLFLPVGLGCIVSSLLTHALIKVMDMYILLMIATLVYGIAISCIALTPFIYLATAAAFVCGCCTPIALIGSFHLCNIKFRGQAYSFHVVGIFTCLSSVITSLISEPFLGSLPLQNYQQDYRSENYSSLNYTGNATSQKQIKVPAIQNCDETVSSLKGLYILLGLLNMPWMLAYVVIFLKAKTDAEFKIKPTDSLTSEYTAVRQVVWKQVIFVTIFLIVFFVCSGLSVVHGDFIVTVSETGILHFGAGEAAITTAAFWFSFLISRLVSTALSIYVRQEIIIVISMVGTVVTAMELTLTTDQTSEVYFWIGTISLGFFMAPMFPGLMAWCRNFIDLSPFVLGLSSIADFTGVTLYPYLAGQIVHRYNVKAYMYFIIGMSMFELLCFGAMDVTCKRLML